MAAHAPRAIRLLTPSHLPALALRLRPARRRLKVLSTTAHGCSPCAHAVELSQALLWKPNRGVHAEDEGLGGALDHAAAHQRGNHGGDGVDAGPGRRGATRSGLFGEGATLKGQKSRPLKGHESPKDSVQPIVRAKGVKNAHTRGCRRS